MLLLPSGAISLHCDMYTKSLVIMWAGPNVQTGNWHPIERNGASKEQKHGGAYQIFLMGFLSKL